MNVNPKPNNSFNIVGTNFTDLFIWDNEIVIVQDGAVIGLLENFWA